MNGKTRIAIGIGAFLIFLCISYMVITTGGKPFAIDLKIQSWVFSLREYGLAGILTAITYLSNPGFIVALIAALLLIPKTRTRIGVPIGISEATAFAIYSTIKKIICRPRPDVSLHLVKQGGFSFPSGHSITSMVVYGLAIYLTRKYVKNEKLKNALTIFFGLLIALIGFSRIYVGVHWPTDIAAGWCFGLAILCLSIGIQKKIENKIKEKKEIKNENL